MVMENSYRLRSNIWKFCNECFWTAFNTFLLVLWDSESVHLGNHFSFHLIFTLEMRVSIPFESASPLLWKEDAGRPNPRMFREYWRAEALFNSGTVRHDDEPRLCSPEHNLHYPPWPNYGKCPRRPRCLFLSWSRPFVLGERRSFLLAASYNLMSMLIVDTFSDRHKKIPPFIFRFPTLDGI